MTQKLLNGLNDREQDSKKLKTLAIATCAQCTSPLLFKEQRLQAFDAAIPAQPTGPALSIDTASRGATRAR
jgi:hypothetical protein